MNNNRTRLIGLIHAQKNESGLDDEAYRSVLTGTVGKESCKECSYGELLSIFDVLNKYLQKQGRDTFKFYPHTWEKSSMYDAVLGRAKKILGDSYSIRLQSFIVSHLHKQNLTQCNGKELRAVMGFLSTVERKENEGVRK